MGIDSICYLIDDVFGPPVARVHEGGLIREARESWEFDISWFSGEVTLDVVCEPTPSPFSQTGENMTVDRLYALWTKFASLACSNFPAQVQFVSDLVEPPALILSSPFFLFLPR